MVLKWKIQAKMPVKGEWPWILIAAFFAGLMLNVPFAIKPVLVDKGPTWYGLDVSWQMTLNYANIKHLVWGKDVIYTYGPLGYLSTRYGWGASMWAFLCFDIFVVINFFFVYKDFLLAAIDKVLAVSIIIALLLVVNSFFGNDVPWILLFFICFWLFKAYHDPKGIYFILISLLILLTLYIKLNTGLISFIFLFFQLLLLVTTRKLKVTQVLGVCGGLALGLTFTLFVFHVSLIDYVRNAMETIRGYNDIMYLYENHPFLENGLNYIFLLMGLLFIFHAVFLVKNKSYAQLYFTVIGLISLFLLKKQSSLRNDTGHLSEFFTCGPLFLIYGVLYYSVDAQKYMAPAILVCIFSSLLVMNSLKSTDIAFTNRLSVITDYLRGVKEFKYLKYTDQEDKRFLPGRVLEKIKNESADVFPWDSEYLLENKLNYTPRPDFQSFCTYTGRLEDINYDFYRDKAPHFVIFDYDAIDGRYPFNEEALVHLFLVKNYLLADTFTSNERWRILLQKKIGVVPLVLDKKKEAVVSDTAEIPVDGCNFLKIKIGYNLRGLVHTFIKKTPQIEIRYIKHDGSIQGFRTSGELLKSGIYVGQFVADNKEFAGLFSGNRAQSIEKIKIVLEGRYYQDNMNVQYFNIK